jgi:hypothetical protein
LIADCAVAGVRLADQGVDKHGTPSENYMAGMDVQARLTVVGDGPVGAVGQPATLTNGVKYVSVSLPRQQRDTRVIKGLSAEEIASEIVTWMGAE